MTINTLWANILRRVGTAPAAENTPPDALGPGLDALRGGPTSAPLHIAWLDGVRALAASFVVFHHIWLMTYGGYPGNNGPWFTGWMVYGHLAVAVFIVVSGYSLSLSPTRNGYVLKEGGWGFIRRRFWRIVPPYWISLIFAILLISTGLIGTVSGGPLGIRDIAVYAFLLQDAVGANVPNGVYWSIAVEWHIYFFFPLILWMFRRYGAISTSAGVMLLLLALNFGANYVPLLEKLDRFTPQFFGLFVLGVLAGWLSHRPGTGRALAIMAGFLATVFLAGCLVLGSRAMVAGYFWVDLLVGAATAALFASMAQGRIRWFAGCLSWRPLAFLGTFAFSLYLIHAPVLSLLDNAIVRGSGLGPTESFWLLLVIGLPVAYAASYGFFLVAERPFLTIRSWHQFIQALRQWLRSLFPKKAPGR